MDLSSFGAYREVQFADVELSENCESWGSIGGVMRNLGGVPWAGVSVFVGVP